MTNTNSDFLAKPWHREPWPWLLMIMPGVALIGGIATAVIAATSWDGLVIDDYYKQGLGINRVMARRDMAMRMRLNARIQASQGRLLVRLPGIETGKIELLLVHPGRSGMDRRITMEREGYDTYAGPMPAVEAVPWRVSLQDIAGKWRLVGTWNGRSVEFGLAP